MIVRVVVLVAAVLAASVAVAVVPGGADRVVVVGILLVAAVVLVTMRRRRLADAGVPVAETPEQGRTAFDLLAASCQATLGCLEPSSLSRVRPVLVQLLSRHAGAVARHVDERDEPGYAYPVDLALPGQSGASGVLLLVRGKAVLAWSSGRGRDVAWSDASVALASAGRIEVGGEVPRERRFGADRLRVVVRGEASGEEWSLAVADVPGMSVALERGVAVATG
ncbi:MAG: hypothetical protein CMH83_18535 [Nocardioides sp.]|nr:hypothetical protein [Nocardioides sp.]